MMESHALKGKYVNTPNGKLLLLDWFEQIYHDSWQKSQFDCMPLVLKYRERNHAEGLPYDELVVVCVKFDNLNKRMLFHNSEIEEFHEV
jgi:hypothetical protein